MNAHAYQGSPWRWLEHGLIEWPPSLAFGRFDIFAARRYVDITSVTSLKYSSISRRPGHHQHTIDVIERAAYRLISLAKAFNAIDENNRQ